MRYTFTSNDGDHNLTEVSIDVNWDRDKHAWKAVDDVGFVTYGEPSSTMVGVCLRAIAHRLAVDLPGQQLNISLKAVSPEAIQALVAECKKSSAIVLVPVDPPFITAEETELLLDVIRANRHLGIESADLDRAAQLVERLRASSVASISASNKDKP